MLFGIMGVLTTCKLNDTENFKFYPNTVRRLIAVEPNLEMYPLIEDHKSDLPPLVDLDVIPGIAQDMSNIEDESIDTVVAFHVLCSIKDVEWH